MRNQDLFCKFAETIFFTGNDNVVVKSRNCENIEISFPPKTQIFAKHETSVYDAEQSFKKWFDAFGFPAQSSILWCDLIARQKRASKIIMNRKIMTCLYSSKSDKMYKDTTVVFENGKLVTDIYVPNFHRNFVLTSCPNFNYCDGVDEFVFFARQTNK